MAIEAAEPQVESPERRRAAGDVGASVVEYAMLIALIMVVCMTAVTSLGSTTSGQMSETADVVAAAN